MSQKIIESDSIVNYIPVKIRRLPTDPFFDEGNWACAQRKQTVVTVEEEELLHKSHKAFECQIAGCNQVFTTLHTFEDHYGSNHRYVCTLCKRNFPSNHILDLHVLEQHDSLFQLTATKKDMYRCLIETCLQTFSSPAERKDHMVKHHKYPSNFRFGNLNATPTKVRSSAIQKVKKVHKSELEPSSMEVTTSNPTNVPFPKINYICRVPGNICFGQGAPRCFQSYKIRGKKKQTTIDMSSVSSALEETMDQGVDNPS